MGVGSVRKVEPELPTSGADCGFVLAVGGHAGNRNELENIEVVFSVGESRCAMIFGHAVLASSY